MDAGSVSNVSKSNKIIYKDRTDEEKRKLLTEKDKKNTQAATDRAMSHFKHFMQVKSYGEVDDLDLSTNKMNEVLLNYYCSIQPQKSLTETDNKYSVQSMKCIRAALNRYFRKQKGIDIVKDDAFIKANEMFKAVCVESKKAGKGIKKSYPAISAIDLERIAEYFCYEHIQKPDPRHLQQNMIFYIIYFFCRRGRENLYPMTKQTFELKTDPDGTQYIIHKSDEIDKNHGIQDTTKTKEGKMYATGCKYKHLK